MGQATIRVVVINDHPIVREGLRSVLAATGDIAVAGESGAGGDAARLVREVGPDVLLIDAALPDGPCEEVVRRLRDAAIAVPILVLTALDGEEDIFGMLDEGVNGYLLTSEPTAALVDAIRGAARGEVGWLSRHVAAALMHRRAMAHASTGVALTAGEREVLLLLARGDDSERIASTLGMAASAVTDYVTSIHGKLRLRARTEASGFARERGLADKADDPPGSERSARGGWPPVA